MSLAAWQTALASLVSTHASRRGAKAADGDRFAHLDLPSQERAWLAQIVDAPGFQLTCAIQRWWRELRLKSSVRLTLVSLLPHERKELLQSWLDHSTGTSFYYAREAIAFLDFVLERLPPGPHREAVCRFERGVHLASSAAWSAGSVLPLREWDAKTTLCRQSTASLVVFCAPSESVLGALLAGTPLPETGAPEFPVLIAPGLPVLCRPATRAESILWDACARPVELAQICGQDRDSVRPVYDLVLAGVLAVVPFQ